MYIFVLEIICLSVCYCIHLPGIPLISEVERQNGVFQDTLPNLGVYRAHLPLVGTDKTGEVLPISGFHSFESEVKTTTAPTTTNPLAFLLNRVFGDDRWKALLQETKFTSPKSTKTASTVSPMQQQTKNELSQIQGFYNYQISGGAFQPEVVKEESQSEAIAIKPNQPTASNNLSSRVGNKSVGNNVALRASTEPPDTTISTFNDNGNTNLQNSNSAPEQGFQGHSVFLDLVTQAPNMGSYQQLSSQFIGNIQSSGNAWSDSGSASFNPNEVNNQLQLFRPSAAFDSFITQTGSDPNNSKLHTSYDADAVNERYMQNGVFRSPPGVFPASQSEKETQHSFNAYAKPPSAFDPDALNKALMDSALLGSKGNPQLGSAYNVRLSASNISPQLQSQQSNVKGHETQQQIEHEEIVKQTLHKAGQAHGSVTFTSTTEIPNREPAYRFNFIPGSLFPGKQQTSKNSLNTQQYSQPSFLSSPENEVKSAGFDPDAVNAAQASFNPNARSWISPRSESKRAIFKVEDDLPDPNTSAPVNQTGEAVSDGTFLHSNQDGSSTYSGFDPNIINAQQGQSNFVPGHVYVSSGYGGNQPNYHGAFSGYTAPSNSNLNPLSGSHSLVNETSLGYGGTGFGLNVGGFNPDSVNMNFANMFGNDSNFEFGMTGYGNGFATGGSGPNMATAGFGTAQAGNPQNGTSGMFSGYGMAVSGGGFDANAVNMPGFGWSTSSNSSGVGASGNGFGSFSYPSMNGGSYGAAIYDANLVNQHLIQNPFETHSSNSSGVNMNYFLGNGGRHAGSSSSYESAFISAFDPSTVNQAVYDPNKFNNARMNFDPLEMLSKNPGMDKSTLQSATFDPDKVNKEYTNINFSPYDMIASSIGMNKTILNGLTFDPSSAGQASFIPSQMGTPHSQLSSNQSSQTQPIFDPVEIMRQLMRNSGSFYPGSSGSQQLNFDPSSMFQQGTPVTTAIPKQQQTSTQLSSHHTMPTSIQTTVIRKLTTKPTQRITTVSKLTTLLTMASNLTTVSP